MVNLKRKRITERQERYDQTGRKGEVRRQGGG